MNQGWVAPLINAIVSQLGPSNTVTETSVLPQSAKLTFPTNFFLTGSMLRITLIGQVSNVVTTPGTINFKVKFGSTIAFDCGAQQMSTTAHTTLPHWLDILLTCRVVGSVAQFIGQGKAHGQMCLRSGADLATDGMQMSPNTAPAVSATWDSTLTQQMDITATTSVSTSGTNYSSQQFVCESLN